MKERKELLGTDQVTERSDREREERRSEGTELSGTGQECYRTVRLDRMERTATGQYV